MKKVTLDRLQSLKEFLNLSYIARGSDIDKSAISRYVRKDADMLKTSTRRERLTAIIGTLRGIRNNLTKVIRFYERKLKKYQ